MDGRQTHTSADVDGVLQSQPEAFADRADEDIVDKALSLIKWAKTTDETIFSKTKVD